MTYERHESEAERLDRNWNEILQELRVAETGVQILFAFLLGLAFTQRFTEITSFQRGIYFVTLLLAAAASALLIAPAAFHRIVFRHHEKDQLVMSASRLALGGLVVLGFAMVGAVFLVTDVLFGDVAASVTAAATALWFGFFWYLLPLRARARAGRDSGGG